MLGRNRLTRSEPGGFNEAESLLFLEFSTTPEENDLLDGVVQTTSQTSMLQTYIQNGSVVGAILTVCPEAESCLSSYYIRMQQGESWDALVEYKGPEGESHFRPTPLESVFRELLVYRMFEEPQLIFPGSIPVNNLYPELKPWQRNRAARYLRDRILSFTR